MRSSSHVPKNKRQRADLVSSIKAAELDSTINEREDDRSTDRVLGPRKTVANKPRRPRKKTKVIEKWFRENIISVVGVIFVGAIIWMSVDSKIEVSKHEIRITTVEKNLDNLSNDFSKSYDTITELKVAIGKIEVLVKIPGKK